MERKAILCFPLPTSRRLDPREIVPFNSFPLRECTSAKRAGKFSSLKGPTPENTFFPNKGIPFKQKYVISDSLAHSCNVSGKNHTRQSLKNRILVISWGKKPDFTNTSPTFSSEAS